MDATQVDLILEKILNYFPPSSLLNFRLVNHTWNRVALQLLTTTTTTSHKNKPNYVMKLNHSNIHEYLVQLRSQYEACNPYLSLLPTELHISLSVPNPNTTTDKDKEATTKNKSTLHQQFQHAILLLLRVDALKAELDNAASAEQISTFFEQLNQHYSEFKSYQASEIGENNYKTYQDSLISVLSYLHAKNQGIILYCTNLEISIQKIQLLQGLCLLEFPALKSLKLVQNVSYNSTTEFGAWLRTSCPSVESLELHFINEAGSAGCGVGENKLIRGMMYKSSDNTPILPNLNHFGLYVAEHWKDTRKELIQHNLQIPSSKFPYLTSISLDFNVVMKLGQIFTMEGGLFEGPRQRNPDLFNKLVFPNVKTLKLSLPHIIILSDESSRLMACICFVLYGMFPCLEALSLSVEVCTIKYLTLEALRGRHNKLGELIRVLLVNFRNNLIKLEIFNYYKDWISELDETGFKRQDIKELKLTIPINSESGRTFLNIFNGKNPTKVHLESILSIFPNLDSIQLNEELLLNKSLTTDPDASEEDSIENDSKKSKEAAAAAWSSKVRVELL